jgi:hypothetical protein
MTDAFPLAWPDGWPRATGALKDGRSNFQRPASAGRYWTFIEAREALLSELLMVSDLRSAVISSDWRLGARGAVLLGAPRPKDEAIAIYFTRKGRSYVMACDRYTRSEENMRSLTLALAAMRQLERHGGGVMLERAFAGFLALPQPKTCWEVLGLGTGVTSTAGDVQAAWRELARKTHPDQGGNHAAMAELNAARDAALKILGDVA